MGLKEVCMGRQLPNDNTKSKKDSKKINELEREIKILEKTISDKHPNNLSNLIRVSRPSFEEQEETRMLKKTTEDLKIEIDKREKEYESKIRSLRQEYERFKFNGNKNSPSKEKENAKNIQIKELEQQIEN